MIIPADERGPGAAAAGAREFIDLLASQNPQLLAIYTGRNRVAGSRQRAPYCRSLRARPPAQQTALLDLIAYRKNESPMLGPGIQFFDWARNMVVDAYYTSPAGIKAIGYMGNTAVAKFEIPQEAIDYALKRSPV